ncbi:hypothetical protein [Cellulosilyticum sp. I15G10I2]|uniref:hypothetical protein n=1 Tax=Cellulosilyticum sp. I15G10I2 TaxID=1892843 RepID=UPI00114D0D65|nr:hypothetical protein [Cellulosilyticum sp. I15G10I2]
MKAITVIGSLFVDEEKRMEENIIQIKKLDNAYNDMNYHSFYNRLYNDLWSAKWYNYIDRWLD